MLELIGYTTRQAEIEILETHGRTTTLLSDLQPVADAPLVAEMIEGVKTVHVADTLKRYIVDLVRATATTPTWPSGRAQGPPWPCCGRPGRRGGRRPRLRGPRRRQGAGHLGPGPPG